ncbi:MAG TPA: hypothetical protein PLG20_09050, partial [Candidatus Syntrophosphaera sp.]|nr:hypothetical protein [Candidatus Syntrophosphaera sp.]
PASWKPHCLRRVLESSSLSVSGGLDRQVEISLFGIIKQYLKSSGVNRGALQCGGLKQSAKVGGVKIHVVADNVGRVDFADMPVVERLETVTISRRLGLIRNRFSGGAGTCPLRPA